MSIATIIAATGSVEGFLAGAFALAGLSLGFAGAAAGFVSAGSALGSVGAEAASDLGGGTTSITG